MRSPAFPPGGTALVRLVLYFTKGLGDVVAAESAGLVPAIDVLGTDDRFLVVAMTAAEAAALGERARTIDDARLLVAGPERITSEDGFAVLCASAAERVRNILASRPGDWSGPWSVTLSARNPGWRDSPGWDPAPVLATHFPGADLGAAQRSPVDLRVQADAEMIHIALNLWSRPIGKRDGGLARPGALRPTVAAALVRLAIRDTDPAVTRLGVYDPFCGTGTVVAEAAHLGLPVFASDIDEHAVELARRRLAGELLARQRCRPAAEPHRPPPASSGTGSSPTMSGAGRRRGSAPGSWSGICPGASRSRWTAGWRSSTRRRCSRGTCCGTGGPPPSSPPTRTLSSPGCAGSGSRSRPAGSACSARPRPSSWPVLAEPGNHRRRPPRRSSGSARSIWPGSPS